ncbi:hypothetical protein D3C72_1510030 [compost metagenome]
MNEVTNKRRVLDHFLGKVIPVLWRQVITQHVLETVDRTFQERLLLCPGNGQHAYTTVTNVSKEYVTVVRDTTCVQSSGASDDHVTAGFVLRLL